MTSPSCPELSQLYCVRDTSRSSGMDPSVAYAILGEQAEGRPDGKRVKPLAWLQKGVITRRVGHSQRGCVYSMAADCDSPDVCTAPYQAGHG